MDERRSMAPSLRAVAKAERADVTVVLPTYNEAGNVERMVSAIRANGYGALVVDDRSPDGTGTIADGLADRDGRVSVLHRQEKQGLGPAYAAGFRRVIDMGAAIVCEIDADFSHDPADLPRLVAAIDDGADLAIGSRYVDGGGSDGWPWHRRFISRGGNLYARTLLRVPVGDLTGGFRAFRAESLRALHPEDCEASGYGFQVEMAWRACRAGMDVREVPIIFRDREIGSSKMSLSIAVEAMWLVTKWGLGLTG
jgi:dolichol-phosphate mannosyltransferase